ncbi:MAG: hypothetical protein O2816_16300 [Planctomycetota bacterium]|nr:hypothetical protein [Planctomycetota bacterium]
MPASDPKPKRLPDPARAASRELRRAFGGLAIAPLRLFEFFLEREVHVARSADCLDAPTPAWNTPEVVIPTDRPLRLFLSCGERSSEVHARRLVEATNAVVGKAGAPAPVWVGLGGRDLAAAGVRTLADPTAKASMGAQGISGQLGFWRGVLTAAGEGFRDARPDVATFVDAPALHLPMARIARRFGVPTLHHVTPQYWAWAPWRVKPYRRVMDRSLSILPFENDWFERHGVEVAYVGHPQQDVLSELPTPPPPDDAGRRTIALLPGSRSKEVEHALPVMLRAVAAARLGDAPVVVLQGSDQHAELIRDLIRAEGSAAKLVVGDPHAELPRARAALATSGTVLLDLLHHQLPTVVLYALTGKLRSRFASWLVTVPYFAGPNLLAREELLPEVAFPAEAPPEPSHVGRLLARCYNDARWRHSLAHGLERAARRLGPAGAAQRAAAHLLDLATAPR